MDSDEVLGVISVRDIIRVWADQRQETRTAVL